MHICQRDPEPLAGVPSAVARVVARALARDRGARWGGADEMLSALVEATPELSRSREDARDLADHGAPGDS